MVDAQGGAGSSESQIQTADTVVLKANPNLVGTVERTYHDFNTHQDPLGGLLIFSHVPVPDRVLQEFLVSSAPPKDYIFVRFADEEFGNSLVAEEDVILLSRCFAVGDTVKRHATDHMIGTVTDVHDSYTLQPICRPLAESRPGQFQFIFSDEVLDACDLTCEPGLPPGVSHPRPHELLYSVPGRELKRAQDFQEGDHILYHDWLGTVRAIDVDVAIVLNNNTVVWVYDPWELFVVVPDLDRSPVAVPELESDDVRLPELNLSLYKGIDTMQPEQFVRGQLVLTNLRNLRNGRWLQGGYDPDVEPAGRVLDVRSRRLEIQWLYPNAFNIEDFSDFANPPVALAPYENLTSFRNARDLRRKKDIVLYDQDRHPDHMQKKSFSRRAGASLGADERPPDNADQTSPKPMPDMRSTGMDLRVGERVKFLNTIAASQKYAGTNSHGHGRFTKLSRDETFGFDLNEFKIISTTEDVTIQWQDSSISRNRSTELRAVVLPEQDLVPGDLVTAKEGMKQVRNQGDQTIESDFNEMSYFEHQQNLRPAKTGVVQSVNSQERIAQVRWFKEPKIELLEAGMVLSDESTLGEIGDSVEDVSLYEIMSFPAFSCRRRDLALLAPLHSGPGKTSEPLNSAAAQARWAAIISGHENEEFRGIVSYLKKATQLRLKGIMSLFGSSTPAISAPDWVAEIVDIGLDGLLTVRFGALDPCIDLQVSRDQVLSRLDEEEALYAPEEAMVNGRDSWAVSDDEDMYDSLEEFEAIDEEIDYEGGRRIDNDSDDGGWETDDDMHSDDGETTMQQGHQQNNANRPIQPQPARSLPNQDAEMREAPRQGDRTQIPDQVTYDTREDPCMATVALISHSKDSQPPSQFDVLSSIPLNQFRVSEPAAASSSLLKRVAREHRILRSSLPSNSIYIRTYESRLDLLRCLIIGPADTPYEMAPFLVDLHLGPQFPKEPPTAHFHSWTSGMGRINPNLYEEGKICLSLLGTWPGKSEGEGWSDKATILQILVSLQGLVFVKQPLYNEAGFELYREEKLFTLESQQYNEKAYVIARGFLKHALQRPVEGLEDVLAWLYMSARNLNGPAVDQERDLLHKAIGHANLLMQRSEELKRDGAADILLDGKGECKDPESVFLKPLSLGAIVQLRRTVRELQSIADALCRA